MKRSFGIRFQQIMILILTTLIIILIVFYGYRPVSYNLSVGSVCNTDIYAPRSFVDTYQTEYNAILARSSVRAIEIRSDSMSDENIETVQNFFTLVRQTRELRIGEDGLPVENFDEEYNSLKTNLETLVGVVPSDNDLHTFMSMSSSAFNLIEDRCVSISEIIMMDNVNTDSLSDAIDTQVNSFAETNPSYASYASSMENILNLLLTPNTIYDADATAQAAENAYLTAQNDPVIVDKGTKIISSGEVITEHTYQNLVDLELIRNESFDAIILSRIAVYEVAIALVMTVYMLTMHKNDFNDMRITYALVVTFIIPIAASVYLADMSTLIIATLFFTTICASYLGISAGIILSLAEMLMMWPLYNFDSEFILVSVVGIVICSTWAGNKKHTYNSASQIIMPALFSLLAAFCYNWLLGATKSVFIESLVWTGVSAAFSIIIAIGLMPIYDLVSNSVSPVRLIELSQPGHPLLKKLFIEASGTYHHSMMVANLADSAAEAIGADALLCKVAAYYHDIGKLENPKYFTENQAEGVNPHDDISIEESVAILTKHPEDGVKLAHKYRLPDSIVKIIDEHHGTTYPGYFYNKAVKLAEETGAPAPDVEKFKYRGHIPSSKESAVVMIADTCEAAIRSMKLEDLDSIESCIRKLIKAKIDQDQLIASGLSFDDIEKIIVAFKQVYAGVFHERIQYPE